MTDGSLISGKLSRADRDEEVRRLLIKGMKCTNLPKKLSHEEIADALTEKLGEPVTAYMIYGWTSARKKKIRFPASFGEAFTEITGDDELARFLMPTRLRQLCELKERELEAERLRDGLFKGRSRAK